MKYLSKLNGTCLLWSRSEILSYELKLIFSSFGRIFIVRAWICGYSAHVNKFDSLSTYESHQDWKSSIWIIHMHTQAFGKISSLVIFRLSSCDSSPPLKLVVGGSSKVHKMSYTNPNLIMSISMSSMRQEEEMGKRPILIFSGQSVVTFQLPAWNLQIQISLFLLIRLEKWR